MLPGILHTLFTRDLHALRRNVELYPSDASLWVLPPGISNSAGTLVLHLTGNLQHYLGALYGGTGYVRDRPLEFSRRDVPRAELYAFIDASFVAMAKGVNALTQEALSKPFPEPVAGRTFLAEDFLLHLVAHAGYHLGQIDYHRRIVTGNNQSGDGVSVLALPVVG